MIKTKWPRMSNEARQEAMDYLKKALKEGFQARKSVGIGAASAASSGNNSSKVFNLESGGWE
jgi:hypothetical protein